MGWSSGSPPLQMLKKLGYRIHLYCSAQLNYYGMETLLFGKDLSLVDSYQKFLHPHPITASDADTKAIFSLKEDLSKDPSLKEGNLFIIFLDSTHFDYSWPKNWKPKFTPFASELAYFKAFYSQKRIEQIKNRYKNAVHYVDFLFGQFQESLNPEEPSIVIVTGDHGEEFFDHGHLFHGSHLTQEQTRVPILMKFPSDPKIKESAFMSQMDIFPSILDFLNVKVSPLIQGESIFQERKKPFVIISRFNAGRTPYEFCIHNGANKLISQFSNRKNIFLSDHLQMISLQTANDQIFLGSFKNRTDWIYKEFGSAFPYLFENSKENISLP
jgi:membrane-anchored protein YejM (alkaline phosphatase superfamily)